MKRLTYIVAVAVHLTVGLFGGLVMLTPARAAEVHSAKGEPAGPPGVPALSVEVQRVEGEVGRMAAAQRRDEEVAAREAAEIERLKEAPPSVGRDLQLPERLARAQAQAAELSQKAVGLKRLAAQLVGARQRLIVACDRALGEGTALYASQRLDLLRVRALQVEALTVPDRGLPAATVRSAALVAEEARSDDPAVLRERADLLRDSADKVRQELSRLTQRAQELQRRRHLRERASVVDEDLFAEQVSSRRVGTSQQGRQADTAAAGPAAPTTPGPGPAGPGPTSAPTVAPRIGLDPATLDLLRRSDDTSDPDVKLQAMRRAQAELGRLADQLGARAASMERRADELRKRK